MRVIWISIVLFAVLVVAGIGLYEPDNSPPVPVALEKTLDNPFAEGQTAAKEVDLPALPQQSATDAETATGAESSNDSQSPALDIAGAGEVMQGTTPAAPASDVTPPGTEIQQASVDESEAVATKESVVIQEAGDDPAGEVTLASPVVESAEAPKLGLAMLELEKENKRNKVAVIVHQDNPQQLTPADIKAMYLDRLTRWQDGSKVMLYNLPLGDKHREKFSQNILNMTALEADSAEAKRRELNIKVNPIEVKAKNIVIAYVERHPNAVAYVPLVLVRDKSSVKVVLTIP